MAAEVLRSTAPPILQGGWYASFVVEEQPLLDRALPSLYRHVPRVGRPRPSRRTAPVLICLKLICPQPEACCRAARHRRHRSVLNSCMTQPRSSGVLARLPLAAPPFAWGRELAHGYAGSFLRLACLPVTVSQHHTAQEEYLLLRLADRAVLTRPVSLVNRYPTRHDIPCSTARAVALRVGSQRCGARRESAWFFFGCCADAAMDGSALVAAAYTCMLSHPTALQDVPRHWLSCEPSAVADIEGFRHRALLALGALRPAWPVGDVAPADMRLEGAHPAAEGTALGPPT